MKFEKITLTLAAALFLFAASNEALAAAKTTTKKSNVAVKSAPKKLAKNVAKSTSKKPIKSLSVNSTAGAAASVFKPIRNSYAPSGQTVVKTISVPVKKTTDDSWTSDEIRPEVQVRANLNTESSRPAAKFSGAVDFQVGRDSNLGPDKTDVEGTYYQVAPSVKFENRAWSGSFGAQLRDFSEQEKSDLFRSGQAHASSSYTAKISSATTSTTTLSGLYNDENWPDHVNGIDADGIDHGMPARYAQMKVEQKLSFVTGIFTTEIGGSAMNQNALSLSTDYADEALITKLYEKDLNQLTAFSTLTLNAASFLDLALKPTVAQVKYTERDGRQSDGSAGGELNPENAPNYELLTNEVALNIRFKLGADSDITPVAVIGQTSDEALGAEDNAYHGFGLTSTLVLDKNTGLTLGSNVMYKKIAYDNWTASIVPSEKRLDIETTAGVSAKVNLAKNFSFGAGYSIVREKSNKFADTSENYRQEIVSSTLTFMF